MKYEIIGKVENVGVSKYIFLISVKNPKIWDTVKDDLEKLKGKLVKITMEIVET